MDILLISLAPPYPFRFGEDGTVLFMEHFYRCHGWKRPLYKQNLGEFTLAELN